MRVLVVEDESALQDQLVELLRHAGYAVDFRAPEGTRLVAPISGTVEAVGAYGGTSTTGQGLTWTQQLGRYVLIRARVRTPTGMSGWRTCRAPA